MYDVDALEKKWKKYKAKKRVPWIGAAILIVLAGLYIFFRAELHSMLGIVPPAEKSVKPSAAFPKGTGTPTVASRPAAGIPHGNITARKSGPLHTGRVDVVPEVTEPKPKMKIVFMDEATQTPAPQQKKHVAKKKKKAPSLQSVEKRFYKTRSYYDSLYLARAYYRKGQYAKAQKWALITNDLNSHVEESWLIFAKSKAKMGQKNEAAAVLRVYIERSNSAKAKKVLRQISQGKI